MRINKMALFDGDMTAGFILLGGLVLLGFYLQSKGGNV